MSINRIASKTSRLNQSWTEYLAERQVQFSLRMFLAILIAHHLPSATVQHYTSKMYYIQYIDPATNTTTIGWDDAFFVAHWVILLVFIRASLMQYVFLPVARHACGIKNRKKGMRFAEQGWSVFYYLISWVLGMYLLCKSDYALSVKNIWAGWPHHRFSPLFKAYYLIQLACWLSQIYVVNVEEKRKDYYQMFTHHIVTVALVTGSYYYYYMRVGHVILVLMDVGDVLLSSAKMLKYAGYNTLCDYMFGLFLICWIICRHGLFVFFTYSSLTDGVSTQQQKCYYKEDGTLLRCFPYGVQKTLVALLCGLQVILLTWFVMIMRVVLKILRGGSAEDNRSDDETDGNEEENDTACESGDDDVNEKKN